MIQLVSPNLSVVGEPDYCLAYTENVFGAPHLEATAWIAWNNTQFKHEDRNLPDVAVPIWCEWYGTVEGVTDNYGHVAVWTGSEVYTNPLSGSGHKVFPSVEAMEADYGVKFVGWSEDISSLRVVEGETMSTVADTEIDQMSWAYFGYGASQDFINEHRGTESNTFERFMFDHPVAVKYRADRAALELASQAPTAPTPAPLDPNSVVITKDGFWASLLAFLRLK